MKIESERTIMVTLTPGEARLIVDGARNALNVAAATHRYHELGAENSSALTDFYMDLHDCLDGVQ